MSDPPALTTPTSRAGGSRAPGLRRWWILGILGIAQLMVVLDATVVNIALPSAQESLAFSDDDRQWIVTAYALAFGSLLLIGGRIADLFGRKQTFVVGAIGFAAASAAGGAAQSFDVLVAARALQGAFAALLAPAALSLLTTTFTDPRERVRAFAIWGAIAGGGGAFGLLLGGVLTQSLDWRWTMYVNILFAVPAAIGALVLLRREARSSRRIDVPGMLTASAGLFALVYGFAQAETEGWGSTITLAAIGVAVVLLAAFVGIERRVTEPMLPLRVVLDRNRGAAFLALGAVGAGMFGVFLFLTFYLQQSLGYSPIETGIAFLPMPGGLLLAAGIATSRLLPRFGPRRLIAPGMAVSGAGMILLAQLGVESSYATDVLPGMFVAGAGLGLVIAPAMDVATLGVKTDDAGVASAMVNTVTQVGGSLGVALLSTVSASAASDYLTGREPGAEAAAFAAVEGYTTAFWWAAGIFIAGAVAAALLLRRAGEALEPDVAADARPSMAF